MQCNDDTLVQREARFQALTKIYQERKDRYHRLASDSPAYNGFVFQNLEVREHLMARRILGILLDYEDALTRKRVESYIKTFDRNQIKKPMEFNQLLTYDFATLAYESDKLTLLHDASVRFLLNVSNVSPEVIYGSTFFELAFLYMYYHHRMYILYKDVIEITTQPKEVWMKDEDKTYQKFDETKEYCEYLLNQYIEQEEVIDVYDESCEVFLTNRYDQFHPLDVFSLYATYENMIIRTMSLIKDRYPDITKRSEREQLYIFQDILNYTSLLVAKMQAKEILLDQESEDLLSEVEEAKKQQVELTTALQEVKQELRQLKIENEKLRKEQQQQLRKQEQQLKQAYHEDVKTAQLALAEAQKTITSLSQDQKELHHLREFLFSQSRDDLPEASFAFDLKAYMQSHKVVCIGGHISLTKKLKEAYPDLICVDRQLLSNNKILHHSDFIFFFTNWMNYSEYMIAIDYIRKYDVPFAYLSGENFTYICDQIKSAIQKL